MSSPNIRLDEVGYQKRTSGASGLTKLYNSRGPPVNTRSGLCVAQITHAITLVDDAGSPCYALHCHQLLVIIHKVLTLMPYDIGRNRFLHDDPFNNLKIITNEL